MYCLTIRNSRNLKEVNTKSHRLIVFSKGNKIHIQELLLVVVYDYRSKHNVQNCTRP